jgi:signal transduction histidine kinase
MDEVRNLAHGIYPPALTDAGLVAALTAVGNRTVPPTAVTARGVGRYRSEVETAVYFCCLEALQNATKHAEGPMSVKLWEDADEVLRFEVADSGPGFAVAATREGHGLTNMRDRLGALGGTVAIVSEPGLGTRVIGAIRAHRR